MPDDPLDGLYEDLKREYDLTLERRRTLTGQATSLMGFAGIIETVLVALLISLATNADVRALLVASPYFSLLSAEAGIGFFSYVLTALFSLLAFWEPRWKRIPKMPHKNPLDSIKYFYDHPDHYEKRFFALQLSEATVFHQETNTRKYKYLRLAMISLVIGIATSAVAGLTLLLIVL